MHRRHFLQAAGAASISSLALAPRSIAVAAEAKHAAGTGSSFDPSRTWHFFDRWPFDQLDNLQLRQGEPVWQRDAVYQEPFIGSLSAWPTVYRDEASGRWRMLYSADWKPYALMVADSPDGRNWSPLPQPDIQPAGGKKAPHHLFTLPGGSGGGVYRDPQALTEAGDGFPFKAYVHQQGSPVVERALADPRHRWHEAAKRDPKARYFNQELTLVSRDGLHWESRYDLCWSMPDWHPEPPLFGYYNQRQKRHMMTVRPGWGDRRVCLQSTTDFRDWSGPELLLQPDLLDTELIEHYGMPVFPYGDGYVGLLWIFHCHSTAPVRGFNRFVGPIDCQLALSRDGSRFTRGLREPFVPVNGQGEPGCGAIQPSCLVETEEEIRIYSAATKLQHGKGSEARSRGMTDNASILLHTLRKDGLMHLRNQGDWGRFLTKPLTLLSPQLTMNAAALLGEVQYQLTDLDGKPVAGFTLEECAPLASDEALAFPLRWKTGRLEDLLGRIVRLEVRLRQADLFAFRGNFHFLDAQDRWLLEDGQPIVTDG
ncbi:hypothetical protein [Lignipirellula cremea]|uniref:Glycosyl hydrolase family 32 N-terminal domain-containing protein n=1 Tax=Lignipirellula cremea TaxID=2528010 RepID=A0A518DVY3_9BACT|nr:hypothetical protein [Lignipirellula cremea]QDU95995.1 hypothetical protein Pla8534_38140 [Lignipirellula cremea]